jgi:SAM-dependent methyltransferase
MLDWGCNHAPDSCLLRAWAGDRYEFHACDVGEPGRFPAFHDFARVSYSRLTHLYKLPYGDAQYDAVIASGVLEHTAMDYESLKELHRVLKPGGVLVVTYLPNRWSADEWHRRNVRGCNFHRRLYGRIETRRFLRHYGFDVVADGYQVKLRSDRQGLAARALPPLAWLSSVLCFAARKVTSL